MCAGNFSSLVRKQSLSLPISMRAALYVPAGPAIVTEQAAYEEQLSELQLLAPLHDAKGADVAEDENADLVRGPVGR